MNLIPERVPYPIYNYYCTFASQGFWITDDPAAPRIKETEMRNRMNSDYLFGEKGLLTCYPKEQRGDILALLDDAWDVPFDITHNEQNCNLFGSMIVNEDKFPEYAHLAPYDRLKALADRIRGMGFGGVGLWIPSNHHGEDRSQPREKILAKAKEFWADRAKMCRYAGIAYVKVDWGYHGRDIEYRSLMTDAFKTYAPDTLIEHVIGIFHKPYDPSPEEQRSPAFCEFMQLAVETIPLCDVYRTYDTTNELAVPTTLMRIARLAEIRATPDEKYAGIINVEDSPIVAAALGMAAGIMRHIHKTSFPECQKAMRWQRLAPPMRFRWEGFTVSETLLCDRFHFHTDPEVWPNIGDGIVDQYAPASIAVNTPPAQIDSAEAGGEVPFLLSSKNTVTGAYTIAAVERVLLGGKRVPLAHVRAKEVPAAAPVGIFGSFASLTLDFDQNISGKRVFLQNLADDEARNVTELVQLRGSEIIIPGELIEEIGAKENDDCLNGLVLVLQ